jgi:hypothetical protein
MKKKAATKKTTKKPKEEKFVFKRFRCEMCGFSSDKAGEHCGYPMIDLLSDACMACKGCGMHF